MTFLQSINLVGEYVLNKAIGEVDAGACVTQVHTHCACRGTCSTNSAKVQNLLYSCFGACNVKHNCC